MTSCGLDWWTDPSHPNISVSVLVPPPCQDTLTQLLSLAHLQFTVTVENLSKLIEEEQTFYEEFNIQNISQRNLQKANNILQ